MIEFLLLLATIIAFVYIGFTQLVNIDDGGEPTWFEFWVMYGIAIIFAFGYFINIAT